MNAEEYARFNESKLYYLKTEKEFWEKEFKEERLFGKFLKEIDFQIEEIIPWEFNKSRGATIYTPDYSIMNRFGIENSWETYNNSYGDPENTFQWFHSGGKRKLNFYSGVKVGEKELDNFRIKLRDQEIGLLGYDTVLFGRMYSHDCKENKENLKFVSKQVDFFKKKGMNEKLLGGVRSRLKELTRGYDSSDVDER